MKHKCENCSCIFERPRKIARFCSKGCYDNSLVGSKASDETKKKMSESKQGYMPVNIFKPGKEHPKWNPDRNAVNPRWSAEYYFWRRQVFERDNHTCVMCGANRDNGVLLDADHIIPFAWDQNKRFDVNNGRVLCRNCHIKQPTWGMKSIKRYEDFTGNKAELIG